MDFTSFNPPVRTLMGSGPSDVHPRILEAMSRPTIGHLDPAFIGMMEELKALLQYAFQTNNSLTLPISAPGSAGMECCFVNLVEPDDKVVICQNGVFGGRMKENVERCGGLAVMVEDDATVRSRLLNEYNLEIGAGLGALAGKVWRIGLMGHASRAENVLLCVSALEAILSDMGALR